MRISGNEKGISLLEGEVLLIEKPMIGIRANQSEKRVVFWPGKKFKSAKNKIKWDIWA